jgi:hypothetical protein
MEEQGKPAKIWHIKRSSMINLAITVIVIGGIVALFTISIGGPGPRSPQAAYNIIKEEVQEAVNEYQANNSALLSTLNGTVAINGSVYRILDVCSLLRSQGGWLRAVPDGIWSGNGSADDNCDSGCGGCSEYSHYIWAVDGNVSVHSTCVGSSCKANGQDGYQGVWP